MDLSTAIVICLLTGGIAAVIARAKHNPAGQAFLVGAFLNVIGIVIVACAPSGLPGAPAYSTDRPREVITDMLAVIVIAVGMVAAAIYPGVQDIMHGSDIFGSGGER